MGLCEAFLNEDGSISLLANTGGTAAAVNPTSSKAKHFLAHDRDFFFFYEALPFSCLLVLH